MRRTLVFLIASLLVSLSSRAEADPWFDLGSNRAEDSYADGDLDAEDLASMPAMTRRTTGGGNLTARTWVSLIGFMGAYPSGREDYGAIVVVGLALDRIAEGHVRVVQEGPRIPLAEGPAPPSPPAPQASTDATQVESALTLRPKMARATVLAAWRAAGLGSNDAQIDAILARARTSAALPEVRLRAMHVSNDTEQSTVVSDTGKLYTATGANLWLEGRFTWRFDRLLYADDEPTLERVRLERQDARSRLAVRTLEVLFDWQRARLDVASHAPGTRAAIDAFLRRIEAESALDVMTAGWFGAQPFARDP